jgi:hypothetical protein
MKPTKTINRIHFEDLSPSRFEDLCEALVYRTNRWLEMNHIGRMGKDGGIDIQSVQELESGAKRTWYIQCKRYKSLTRKDFKEMVEVFRKRKIPAPDVFLVVVSCDVSKLNIDYYRELATQNGIANPIIWFASTIETKLFTENHDLLFAYFGISLSMQSSSRIASIRRNIEMKKKLRRELLKPSFDFHRDGRQPFKRFQHSKFIIRSITDTLYPEFDPDATGISPWFKIEPYDFYHNGLGVVLSIQYVAINDDDIWDVLEYKQEPPAGFEKIKVYAVGNIPFENIVAYDDEGDEFYGNPHIYCDFKNNGMPYEDFVYHILCEEDAPSDCYPVQLDNKKRTKFASGAPVATPADAGGQRAAQGARKKR